MLFCVELKVIVNLSISHFLHQLEEAVEWRPNIVWTGLKIYIKIEIKKLKET